MFIFKMVLKAIVAALFMSAYSGAVIWVAIEGIGFISGNDIEQVLLVLASVSAVIVIALLSVFNLPGLSKFLAVVEKGLLWCAAGGVIALVLALGLVAVVESRGNVSIALVLLGMAGTAIGAYVVYLVSGMVVGFFGSEFEKFANAMPRGRGLLFAEALDNGYLKPQARAFISELTYTGGGGISFVYPSFMLYVLPLLSIAVTLIAIM